MAMSPPTDPEQRGGTGHGAALIDAPTPPRRGNRLGFLIFDLYLSLGLRHAYGLVWLVCLYYLAADRWARQTLRGYLNHRFGPLGRWRRLVLTYQLMVANGKILVDLRQFERNPAKVARNIDAVQLRARAGHGGLIVLTAHVGLWQAMMGHLGALGRPVNVVMRPTDHPAAIEFLRIGTSRHANLAVIDPGAGPEAALAVVAALNRGEIVAMMGDRPAREETTLTVDLLGGAASLPAGPFALAAATDAPILLLLARRDGPCAHTMEIVELPLPPSSLPRAERRQRLAQAYADALGGFLQRHPFAWGNLADLWQEQE
jgi:predicted LPLAT superfamily acyltransferase